MRKDFQDWHNRKSTIDARRLSYRIGEISEIDFNTLKEKLKALFLELFFHFNLCLSAESGRSHCAYMLYENINSVNSVNCV
jgi:DNA phosphorothioation-dependent restriction protein DptG